MSAFRTELLVLFFLLSFLKIVSYFLKFYFSAFNNCSFFTIDFNSSALISTRLGPKSAILLNFGSSESVLRRWAAKSTDLLWFFYLLNLYVEMVGGFWWYSLFFLTSWMVVSWRASDFLYLWVDRDLWGSYSWRCEGRGGSRWEGEWSVWCILRYMLAVWDLWAWWSDLGFDLSWGR